MRNQSIKNLLLCAPSAGLFLLVCSIAICVMRYVLMPTAVATVTRINENKTLQAACTQDAASDNMRARLLKEESELQRINMSVFGSKSDPSDLSAALTLLVHYADSAGISFVKMQPQDAVQETDRMRAPVLLEMTTSCTAFTRLLATIESFPRIFSIDRLAVTTRTNGTVDVKILCTCFWQRERLQ